MGARADLHKDVARIPDEQLGNFSAIIAAFLAATGQRAETVAAGSRVAVLAPMAGVWYLEPAPELPPFVSVGDRVKGGGVVGLVEAMKLYNDVTAPRSGVVEEILVRSGDHVEQDQILMWVV